MSRQTIHPTNNLPQGNWDVRRKSYLMESIYPYDYTIHFSTPPRKITFKCIFNKCYSEKKFIFSSSCGLGY